MSTSFDFKSAVILATESYLMLPVILWVIMWLQPWLALPIALGLMYIWGRHAKFLLSHQEAYEKAPGIKMWILYAFIAFLAVFFIGLDGRVLQSWDLIYRNAIYSELIVSDWPLVMPDGKEVMYALMFWLPPALVSKCLIPGVEIAVLQCWCYIGALLMLLNLHGTLGATKTVLVVIGMAFLVPLAGIVDDTLNVIFHMDAIMGVHFRLPSATSQWTNTFHYFITAGLFLTLTTERKLPLSIYITVSALFACLHPILASVVLPLVLFNVIKDIRRLEKISTLLKLPEVYVGVIITLITLMYYSSGGTCWWDFTLNAPYAPTKSPWLIYALGMILAIVPLLLVWWSTRRTIMLMWVAWSIIIITLWYGETNGVNEWLYKFTVLYSFYIVYYLVQYVGQRRSQYVMGLLLLCSSLSSLRAFDNSELIDSALKGFPVEQKNIRNDLQGRFYHPQDSIYKKMTADKDALPCIFR